MTACRANASSTSPASSTGVGKRKRKKKQPPKVRQEAEEACRAECGWSKMSKGMDRA